MRIEQLIYLIEIAKCGSISSAAEQLHISQPGISQAIDSLEEEMNTKLFQRSKRLGTKPTEDGKKAIKIAKEILGKFEELKEVSNAESDQLNGTLSFSVIPSVCMSVLPKTLAAYKDRFPLVKIELTVQGSLQIESDVLNGKIDIGIISNGNYEQKNWEHSEKLSFEKLHDFKTLACVGQQSPLSRNDSVSPEEILNYPIVISNSDYKMYHKITALLRKYGEPNILLTTGNTEASKRIIAEGLGIGFYTDLELKNDPYVLKGKIIPLQISGEEKRSAFGWIKLKDQYLSTTSREFIKVLKSTICVDF
ncbi:LysR family transcriptional regulator [Cytobacillus depressus]|uniref:LysR family transcriptional regulator n=1 Tax=Cytobacillus depressus TaxID=1602942 RepID=A0A6L3VA54_9BACI|nr:LysR family transcriptional regulator [Cytobacillus depressus]KAB2336247.1 LysR family transcriptional regulator [Cytobacillus depressus]